MALTNTSLQLPTEYPNSVVHQQLDLNIYANLSSSSLRIWLTSSSLYLFRDVEPRKSLPSSFFFLLLSASQVVSSQDSANKSKCPLVDIDIVFQVLINTSLNDGDTLYLVISLL